MEFPYIVIFLATGMVAGFAGGMLGLGGAFIMTPVQYIVFTDMGLSADYGVFKLVVHLCSLLGSEKF